MYTMCMYIYTMLLNIYVYICNILTKMYMYDWKMCGVAYMLDVALQDMMNSKELFFLFVQD